MCIVCDWTEEKIKIKTVYLLYKELFVKMNHNIFWLLQIAFQNLVKTEKTVYKRNIGSI